MAENNGGNSFMWFLAGLGVGALVGVLYAPKSGRETRQMIRDGLDEGRGYVTEQAQHYKQQATQWVDKGKDTIRHQKDQIGAAIDAGRQAYREATSEPKKS